MFRITILFSLMGFVSYAQPTNVLFIGNSFTHMNSLCKIYQDLSNSKGKIVFADTLAVSGSTLKGHTERPYTYVKLNKKKWDYVFIQGMSRELSYDSLTIATETIPYAKQLIDSIKKYNSCAKIYYYMTWGYLNGSTSLIPNDTYESMQLRIQKGYLQMSQATGGYPIAPIGMVWKEIREKYPEINLYTQDSIHPSINGSLIAASTFYTAVYKESPVNGAVPKKVTEIDALHIQLTAAKYVLTYYPKYNLDTIQIPKRENPPKLNFDVKKKWLSITISNKTTSSGLNYFWDFGDGKTSTKRNPKHYYSAPGKYYVTLYINSFCNWYDMTKVIEVINQVKTANTKPKPN